MERKFFLGMTALVYANEGTYGFVPSDDGGTTFEFTRSWVKPILSVSQNARFGPPGSVTTAELIPIDMGRTVDDAYAGRIDWKDAILDGPGLRFNSDVIEPAFGPGHERCEIIGMSRGPTDYVITSLGPAWPSRQSASGAIFGGLTLGTVYLESKLVYTRTDEGGYNDLIETDTHAWPPYPYVEHPYEVMTIAYPSTYTPSHLAGRRYAGFRGTIVGRSGPNLVRVKIDRSGDGFTQEMGTWWFNLEDPADCDQTVTAEDLEAACGGNVRFTMMSESEGAFFIELGRVAELTGITNGLRPPKFPFYLER